jgi:hypothetical protein
VKTTGQTGVEMEALTAVSVAALTVYDMLKAAEKGMEIGGSVSSSRTAASPGATRPGGDGGPGRAYFGKDEGAGMITVEEALSAFWR